MPNDDPRDGFIYRTLTLMMDSYSLNKTGFFTIHNFC